MFLPATMRWLTAWCALRRGVALLGMAAGLGMSTSSAEILWSDPDPRLVHHTDNGYDILGGVVARDDVATDTLYFKFTVDPLSDVATEEYFAAFQLFEGDEYRLAVGNAPEAWGYSAFYAAETGPDNKLPGEINLKSTQPEPSGLGVFKPYELPRHDNPRTIVFKVQFLPGADDLVTVWLSPNLDRGATDANQPEALTTKFKADASFDQVRLRHGGNGNGWIFSQMAVATSFEDFVVERFWQTWWFNALMGFTLLASVVATVRIVEKRKFQRKLMLAEQGRALERERTRIAQDLHDDLGSSLTRISLLSGLVRADKDSPEQVEAHAGKLAAAAEQTVRALEEIVWALRPGSDTLQSLVEYIAHFAQELFEGDAAQCRLDLPTDLPAVALPPEMRHNVFLIVKEALTNALKHAHAQQVMVTAKVDGGRLEITVADDGRGLAAAPSANPAERNGLGNMQRRADAMGGLLTVTGEAEKGTRVSLVVDLPGQRN
jgi:signal transduction histidine kinase